MSAGAADCVKKTPPKVFKKLVKKRKDAFNFGKLGKSDAFAKAISQKMEKSICEIRDKGIVADLEVEKSKSTKRNGKSLKRCDVRARHLVSCKESWESVSSGEKKKLKFASKGEKFDSYEDYETYYLDKVSSVQKRRGKRGISDFKTRISRLERDVEKITKECEFAEENRDCFDSFTKTCLLDESQYIINDVCIICGILTCVANVFDFNVCLECVKSKNDMAERCKKISKDLLDESTIYHEKKYRLKAELSMLSHVQELKPGNMPTYYPTFCNLVYVFIRSLVNDIIIKMEQHRKEHGVSFLYRKNPLFEMAFDNTLVYSRIIFSNALAKYFDTISSKFRTLKISALSGYCSDLQILTCDWDDSLLVNDINDMSELWNVKLELLRQMLMQDDYLPMYIGRVDKKNGRLYMLHVDGDNIYMGLNKMCIHPSIRIPIGEMPDDTIYSDECDHYSVDNLQCLMIALGIMEQGPLIVEDLNLTTVRRQLEL